MTAQEFIEKNYHNGCGYWMLDTALQEYAKIKCQELLEIVAEKAKVKGNWEYSGGSPKVLGSYSKRFVGYEADKDSILNAVNLDSFCS